MAMNAAQAAEMVATAKAAGLLLGVAQNYRYNRSGEWVREQVLGGRIGRPQLAQKCIPSTVGVPQRGQ